MKIETTELRVELGEVERHKADQKGRFLIPDILTKEIENDAVFGMSRLAG